MDVKDAQSTVDMYQVGGPVSQNELAVARAFLAGVESERAKAQALVFSISEVLEYIEGCQPHDGDNLADPGTIAAILEKSLASYRAPADGGTR